MNVHQDVCVFGVSCFECVCMHEFLACHYEMCVFHVEQDSRPLRPGSCLGSKPRVVSFLGCETLGVAHEGSAPGHSHSHSKRHTCSLLQQIALSHKVKRLVLTLSPSQSIHGL